MGWGIGAEVGGSGGEIGEGEGIKLVQRGTLHIVRIVA